jgi:cytochrome c553
MSEHEMKAQIAIGMMTLGLVLVTNPLFADKGKTLYENNCSKCHGTEVFTRDDRGVKSLEGLKSRVKQCNNAVESKLSDDEIKSVANYLNKNFYKF